MIDTALIDWKIANDDNEKYTKPYVNGLNLGYCFHFKIDLSFFTKNEFLKVRKISAEDFIKIMAYMCEMQIKYQDFSKTKEIPIWLNKINEIRTTCTNQILIHNDIRVNGGLIVPIANANYPQEYKNGALQTLILSTSLWKKFYKTHKDKIDDLIYEEFKDDE